MTDAVAEATPDVTIRHAPWIIGAVVLAVAALIGYRSYRGHAVGTGFPVKSAAPVTQRPCSPGAVEWHCRVDL